MGRVRAKGRVGPRAESPGQGPSFRAEGQHCRRLLLLLGPSFVSASPVAAKSLTSGHGPSPGQGPRRAKGRVSGPRAESSGRGPALPSLVASVRPVLRLPWSCSVSARASVASCCAGARPAQPSPSCCRVSLSLLYFVYFYLGRCSVSRFVSARVSRACSCTVTVAAVVPLSSLPRRSCYPRAGGRSGAVSAGTCWCIGSVAPPWPAVFPQPPLGGGPGSLVVASPRFRCPCLCSAFSSLTLDGLVAVPWLGGDLQPRTVPSLTASPLATGDLFLDCL
jgi:hypothetical protein